MPSIKIGTDCSGMEAPVQALQNLKVNLDHKFSCDINKEARATIGANFPHGLMYDDLTKRDNKKAPKVDLYIAGFPCQPFSKAGVQQGFKDKKGRGKIFFHVLDFIATTKPKVFILENVSGLVTLNKGKYMNAILAELESLGEYNIQWKLLDTKKNGIPHSRRRWYCVGINKNVDDGSFKFPEPIACAPLNLFLERKTKHEHLKLQNPKVAAGLPPKTQTTALGNVRTALKTLKREGSDPLKDPFIVDCDSSPERSIWRDGVVPCITVSRAAGHWVTNRGRRLLKTEMMRLQGMDPTKFKVAISENSLGKQLGNTMSVNVLERLFVRLLPAAGLVRKGEVKDRWENGSAVRKLAATRGRCFKSISAKAKKLITDKAAATRSLSPPRRALKRTMSSPKAAAAAKRRRHL